MRAVYHHATWFQGSGLHSWIAEQRRAEVRTSGGRYHACAGLYCDFIPPTDLRCYPVVESLVSASDISASYPIYLFSLNHHSTYACQAGAGISSMRRGDMYDIFLALYSCTTIRVALVFPIFLPSFMSAMYVLAYGHVVTSQSVTSSTAR